MADDPDQHQRVEIIAGLAKGLAIIELFDTNRSRLTVSEAASATDVSPASARRCLLTLLSLGYVTHDGKFFRPTPRLARLGTSYDAVSPLPTLAYPFLETVQQELHESASLAVLDGADALFVARVESARIVSIGGRVGSRLPAHASATGRVLLAALDEQELDQRLEGIVPVRTTQNTVVDMDEIRERISRTRESGLAITNEELEIGVNTMAVPVRDSLGRVHAAMSTTAYASRTSVSLMHEEYLPVLRREAEALGRML